MTKIEILIKDLNNKREQNLAHLLISFLDKNQNEAFLIKTTLILNDSKIDKRSVLTLTKNLRALGLSSIVICTTKIYTTEEQKSVYPNMYLITTPSFFTTS